ncbi:hypothetical protein H1Q63_17860 [Desmonostoc muscorum CCALA 125]|nr:hypothetical protein [Desmonostoc muscorum CCALA 125]
MVLISYLNQPASVKNTGTSRTRSKKSYTLKSVWDNFGAFNGVVEHYTCNFRITRVKFIFIQKLVFSFDAMIEV